MWNDWELVEEYTPGNVVTAKYLQGAHGPIKSLLNNVYYYQDSLGSTSHIASSSGALLEYYKYDLYGKPTYWNASGNQIWASAVKDLFSGERWIPEISMYDLRNRFYSPDLGRFLQPDPISFKGDASNLYRYCGNDWANKTDPMGLQEIFLEVPPILLESEVPRPIISDQLLPKEGAEIPRVTLERAIRLNKDKNSVRLPDGRRVDLKGRGHPDPKTGQNIPTPHVHEPKAPFDAPYEHIPRAPEKVPRPAKPDDIREVIRHLENKLKESKPERTGTKDTGAREKSQPEAKTVEPPREGPKSDNLQKSGSDPGIIDHQNNG